MTATTGSVYLVKSARCELCGRWGHHFCCPHCGAARCYSCESHSGCHRCAAPVKGRRKPIRTLSPAQKRLVARLARARSIVWNARRVDPGRKIDGRPMTSSESQVFNGLLDKDAVDDAGRPRGWAKRLAGVGR